MKKVSYNSQKCQNFTVTPTNIFASSKILKHQKSHGCYKFDSSVRTSVWVGAEGAWIIYFSENILKFPFDLGSKSNSGHCSRLEIYPYLIKGKVKRSWCQLSLVVSITEQRIPVKCEQEPRIFWKFYIPALFVFEPASLEGKDTCFHDNSRPLTGDLPEKLWRIRRAATLP